MAGMLLKASATFLAAACAMAHAEDLSGTYSLRTRATVYSGTKYERHDLTRERKISETSVAMGADDLGTLKISPDGTYELRYWYYAKIDKAPVITGRWAATAKGEFFAESNAIKLIDAVPAPDRAPPHRAWYIFRDDAGLLNARYSPFAEYVMLTPQGAAKRPAR